jgi:hypothetical protein
VKCEERAGMRDEAGSHRGGVAAVRRWKGLARRRPNDSDDVR